MSSDRILTGGVWISGNCILDLSSTSKIERDDRGTFAIFQGSGNVKSILPELVVCGSYEVTAELDCVSPIAVYDPTQVEVIQSIVAST